MSGGGEGGGNEGGGEHDGGGEHGGGGGGGHSSPPPHPVGEAGQALDQAHQYDSVQQALANGQVPGSTTGPQAGIDINNNSAYMSGAEIRAANEAARHMAEDYDQTGDLLAPAPDPLAHYDNTDVPLDPGAGPSGDAGFAAPSHDAVAADAAAANPPPAGGYDDAIPLQDMAPGAPMNENAVANHPPDVNHPPYDDAASKESLLRSKKFWAFVGAAGFLSLLTIFLVGVFQFRWFGGGAATDPVAQPIKRSDLPQGKPVTLSLADHVTKGANEIDWSTLALLTDGGEVTALDDAGEGGWSVDRTAGTITFTPAPAATRNPDVVTYRIKDTAGIATNKATITLEFAGFDTAPTPLPDDGMEAPVAKPISLANQAPGTTVTFDIASNVDKGLFDTDFTTVVLVGAPADRKMLKIDGKGTWTVDPASGAISFAPDPALAENPMPQRYQVRDVMGRVSNEALLTVRYSALPMPVVKMPPQTVDAVDTQYLVDTSTNPPHFDPITFDMEKYVTRGSADIDWSTLRISSRLPVMGDAPAGVTTFDAADEGTWTVDVGGRTITFAPVDNPNRAFTGSPTPIAWWVADVNGLRSLPKFVIANEILGKIADEIKVMAAKDDAIFWTDYKETLIDSNVTLEVIYALTYQLEAATDAMMSPKARIQARGDSQVASDNGFKIRGNVYTGALDQWTDGTSAQMWQIVESTVDAELNGVGGLEPLARRYIQIAFILRLLRDQFITLEQMRAAGGGQG